MSSSQIKIAIVSGSAKKADSVRGIGAHNSELFGAFSKESDNNYPIPDLSMNDDLSAYDVVHFTSFRPFFISLPFTKPEKTKFILTIHDLIMLIYPKHYPSGIKGRIRFEINKYLIKKYVDRIITISETSKKDICRFLNVKPEIVDVVYIAPKNKIKILKSGKWEDEIRKKYNLPVKFVLFDHGVNYNKNLPTLIKACKIAKIPLAVVGKEIENIGKFNLNSRPVVNGPFDLIRNILGIQHPQISHLEEVQKELDSPNVIKLGYVSDEDLNKLFNLATIYVQPSFYEGFGMPVVEAMTVGCPVISSRTQALVEVAGDACLYFDPHSVDDLVEKINIFKNSEALQKEYIKKGFERVKKFSWKKAAQETLDVYAKSI